MPKLKIPSKYSEKVVGLVETLNEQGFSIRFEKGNFKSSSCIVEGQKQFIINKSYTNHTNRIIFKECSNKTEFLEQFELH